MPWASAVASDPSADRALRSLVSQGIRGLGPARAQVAFLFVGAPHAAEAERLFAGVRDAFPGAAVVGASAGGVLGAGREHEGQPALSLLVGGSEGLGVRAVFLEQGSLPDGDAGPAAWHARLGVPPGSDPGFVLLADPFTFPAEELAQGLDFAYPGGVKVGGLASGAARAGEQVLFAGDRVVRSGAVAAALTGSLSLVPAVAQGCRPVGPALRITRSEGPLLCELDRRPALEVLQGIWAGASERDRHLMQTSLFLGFATDALATEEGPWLIRNLGGVHPTRGGLFTDETLRVGRRVRFHVRDRVSSADDVARTLEEASSRAGRPEAALLFSCLGRGMNLYGSADHDSRAFHARFGDVPLAGFFCSGEIGPVGAETRLHGYTSCFGLLAPRRP